MSPTLISRHALLDELLHGNAGAIGQDFAAYRNHTYRVLNFGAALGCDAPEPLEKVAVAAAFHDLGIWTHKTFDYLGPSAELARGYLDQSGRAEWIPEVSAMIQQHHKVTSFIGDPSGLVESFRQADWIDVTRGIRAFGLPRVFLREAFAAFPNAGFHKRLVQLVFTRLIRHPLNPLPMYRF